MNKKEMFKTSKGITLIALVITIIILIILAGVSISVLLGNDGLLNKATHAKKVTDIAQEKEGISIAFVSSKLDNQGYIENVTKENFDSSLKNQFGKNSNIETTDNKDGSFTVTFEDTDRVYYVESNGNIIENDKILKISTADELKAFRDDVNSGNTYEGKYVFLTKDITLDVNEEWEPIGLYLMTNSSPDDKTNIPFKGVFNGQGYEVNGIYINTTDKAQGLFGLVDSGKVINLSIGENNSITGGSATAGVVGYLNNESIINNCTNKATIKAVFGGGIAGCAKNSKILNSHNVGNIEGDYNLGGVVGLLNYSSMINCYNIGNVKGDEHTVGGLVGFAFDSSIISNCYNNGQVEGGYNVGGIVGNLQAIITKCYNNATIIGNSSTAYGNSVVGGICGLNTGAEIKDVYNTGEITGVYPYVGGVVGVNRGNLCNSYNIGKVNGDVSGGIVGINDSHNDNKGKISNSYSLEDDTINLYGENTTIISDECSEKSSENLKIMANVLGNSFKEDKNNINQGYPILSWQ